MDIQHESRLVKAFLSFRVILVSDSDLNLQIGITPLEKLFSLKPKNPI